jgi:hypothetical protein
MTRIDLPASSSYSRGQRSGRPSVRGHEKVVPEAKEWRPVTETGFRRKKYAVYVWRSVREDGDTKTEKSRRTPEIPDDVAQALKEHHAAQATQRLQAGKAWQDNDLVFCTSVGSPLDAANVRRSFRPSPRPPA